MALFVCQKVNPESRDLATGQVETGDGPGRVLLRGSLERFQPFSIQKLVLPSSDWLPSELEKGTILTILTFFSFF